MSKYKCLILGGGGFLGSHLSAGLLEAGHTVRIFDRPRLNRRGYPNMEHIEWIEGDFVNTDDLGPAVRGCDVVVHLVSTTLPKSSNENPVYDVETNVIGTLRLLELARSSGVGRIVFASSGGTIYGVPKNVPISEEHATNPVCSYGIGKLMVEKYLQLYHELHGLDYSVLRISNPYGQRQQPKSLQGAVAVFIGKALRNETIEIWGDGTVVRDYIYVDDVVRAFLAALTVKSENAVFNIGSGKGLSLNQLLYAIEAELGRQVTRRYVAARRLDVPISVMDISKAKSVLDWNPEIPFAAGLRKTVEWNREEIAEQGIRC